MNKYTSYRLRSGRRLLAFGVVLLLPVAMYWQPAASAQPGRPFQPRQVVPEQKPIVNPATVPASQVKSQVTGNELVLGVVVEGEARAYPINMLTGPRREIINDSLAGQAIAATW